MGILKLLGVLLILGPLFCGMWCFVLATSGLAMDMRRRCHTTWASLGWLAMAVYLWVFLFVSLILATEALLRVVAQVL